jgi:hypothetical protein
MMAGITGLTGEQRFQLFCHLFRTVFTNIRSERIRLRIMRVA